MINALQSDTGVKRHRIIIASLFFSGDRFRWGKYKNAEQVRPNLDEYEFLSVTVTRRKLW